MIRSSADKISDEEEVQQEENESHEITREKVPESCIIVSSPADDIIVVTEDKDLVLDDIFVTGDNDLVLSMSSCSTATKDADVGGENRIIGGYLMMKSYLQMARHRHHHQRVQEIAH